MAKKSPCDFPEVLASLGEVGSWNPHGLLRVFGAETLNKVPSLRESAREAWAYDRKLSSERKSTFEGVCSATEG